MSRQVVIMCNGCARRTDRVDDEVIPIGWFTLYAHDDEEDTEEWEFCSWLCLRTFVTQRLLAAGEPVGRQPS